MISFSMIIIGSHYMSTDIFLTFDCCYLCSIQFVNNDQLPGVQE